MHILLSEELCCCAWHLISANGELWIIIGKWRTITIVWQYYYMKLWLYEKWLWEHRTMWFPFIRGVPPMKQIKSTIPRWLLSDNTTYPPIDEMKSIFLWWLLSKYSTVWTFRLLQSDFASIPLRGFPFIKGSPPHKWNEFHPYTMTTI